MCDDYKQACTKTLNIPELFSEKRQIKVCDKHIHMNLNVAVILKETCVIGLF